MASYDLPYHIGIIMDGNGRWALQRGLIRTKGHVEGLHAAKRVVRGAIACGIPYLSLYTFSTENWNRSVDEVQFLLRMIGRNLRQERQFYIDNDVKVIYSGSLDELPRHVVRELHWVENLTRHHAAITVNLAINYGGRNEIIRAINRWRQQSQNHPHQQPQQLSPDSACTEQSLQQYFDLPTLPHPDLIIRTGGELRLSNFMIWQAAYSELYFSDKFWPDWDETDLDRAIQCYRERRRNFGGINLQLQEISNGRMHSTRPL